MVEKAVVLAKSSARHLHLTSFGISVAIVSGRSEKPAFHSSLTDI